jgi:hypothetical protein
MALSASELKFLLKLLGQPGYRSAMSALSPNAQTKPAERDKICRQLCSRGLVDYLEEVTKFAILPAGKTLLGLDTSVLPVTPSELAILKACQTQTISPSQVGTKVPATERQRLIRALADRGLVVIKASKLKEAWLNPVGIVFLRDECLPEGTANIVSGKLLSHYLRFLRTALGTSSSGLAENTSSANAEEGDESIFAIAPITATSPPTEPSAEDVLSTIQTLDQTLNTDNYLPIYHLREKLQPPLTREALNELLYQLQRADQIELSTLQHGENYTETQIAAGIPQEIGGPLFFISVLEQ